MLMSLSSLFLLTSVFMLILSTVPGFQNATRDMFGVKLTASSTFIFHLFWSCCSGGHRHWGRGGKPVSQDNWGHLCWLVHLGISHQICCLPLQGKDVVVIRSLFHLSMMNLLDWVPLLLPQHYRCPGNSPLLHLAAPQQVVLRVQPGVHSQGCSNISHLENIENLQTVPSHHGTQDPGTHPP